MEGMSPSLAEMAQAQLEKILNSRRGTIAPQVDQRERGERHIPFVDDTNIIEVTSSLQKNSVLCLCWHGRGRSFSAAQAIADGLPKAEVYVLSQGLQHLTELSDIRRATILELLAKFSYIFVALPAYSSEIDDSPIKKRETLNQLEEAVNKAGHTLVRNQDYETLFKKLKLK
jgi:hypothetical protein